MGRGHRGDNREAKTSTTGGAVACFGSAREALKESLRRCEIHSVAVIGDSEHSLEIVRLQGEDNRIRRVANRIVDEVPDGSLE